MLAGVSGLIKKTINNVAMTISSMRTVRTSIILHLLVHLYKIDHTMSLLVKKIIEEYK